MIKIVSFLKVSKVTLLSVLLVTSLILTVASHTVEKVSGMVSAALGMAGISSVVGNLTASNQTLKSSNQILEKKHAKMATNRKRLSGLVSEVTGKIYKRTAKVAAASIGAMPAQGIPFLGVAAVVAATAYEVDQSCETMKDLHELDLAFNPDNELDSGVCGVDVPTTEDLKKQWSDQTGEIYIEAVKWGEETADELLNNLKQMY
jgi:hypothetical protein